MVLKRIFTKNILLVKSKLLVPAGREVVHRERLISLINSSTKRKFTIVSAPAGFGKTTLLIEWVRHTHLPVAWLSLGQEDDDRFIFWVYFFSAFKNVNYQIGDLALNTLKIGNEHSVIRALSALINEAENIADHMVIILDDYHWVKSHQIHSDLSFLIEHLPNQIHLIISGRYSPPLSLARLRGIGELAEIQAKDLRFTLDESTRFLNGIMNMKLSPELLRLICQRTEGWIAGLQIAALSAQNHNNVAEFVHNFSGSNKYIGDYLIEEVFANQPSDVQSFLYETSILDQLSADLCDYVTNIESSKNILDYLENANLFINPLDDERLWYSYHPLLRELLYARLIKKNPVKVQVLQERAAKWYEEHGLFPNAVKFFIDAAEYSQTARLVNRFAIDYVLLGEIDLLLYWINKIPEEVINKWPMLLVYRAWTLISSKLDFQNAEEYLRRAEKLIINFDVLNETNTDHLSVTDSRNREVLLGAINSIFAYLVRLRGDFPSAITHAKRALETLPLDEHVLRGWAYWNLAQVYRYSDEIENWKMVIDQVWVHVPKIEQSGVSILILDSYAELLIFRGQLQLAEKVWHQALVLAETHFGSKHVLIASTIYCGLGMLYFEWNDLNAAEQYLTTAVDLAERGGMMEVNLEGHISLARLNYIQGNHESALSILQNMELTIQSRPETKHSIRARAYQAIWEHRRGNRAYFNNWVETRQLKLNDQPDYLHEPEYFILARALMFDDKADMALKLIEYLYENARSKGRMGTEIKALVIKAIALEKQGETAKALVSLKRALSLAEPSGYVRVFLEGGRTMSSLLHKLAARGSLQTYVNKLISAFGDTYEAAGELKSIVEPLSERELGVLRLIAAHLSSREIAEELNISINTVRTHKKNIYGKLNVHNHSEAIAYAETMGLVA